MYTCFGPSPPNFFWIPSKQNWTVIIFFYPPVFYRLPPLIKRFSVSWDFCGISAGFLYTKKIKIKKESFIPGKPSTALISIFYGINSLGHRLMNLRLRREKAISHIIHFKQTHIFMECITKFCKHKSCLFLSPLIFLYY